MEKKDTEWKKAKNGDNIWLLSCVSDELKVHIREEIDKDSVISVGAVSLMNFHKIYFFISANLSSVALGTTLGWTSPAFPKFQDITLSDSPLSFVPSTEELSWIGSLVALGALVGNTLRMTLKCVEVCCQKYFQYQLQSKTKPVAKY